MRAFWFIKASWEENDSVNETWKHHKISLVVMRTTGTSYVPVPLLIMTSWKPVRYGVSKLIYSKNILFLSIPSIEINCPAGSIQRFISIHVRKHPGIHLLETSSTKSLLQIWKEFVQCFCFPTVIVYSTLSFKIIESSFRKN